VKLDSLIVASRFSDILRAQSRNRAIRCEPDGELDG
jgi:hypothetical protein